MNARVPRCAKEAPALREREKSDKSAGGAVNVTGQVNLGDVARLQLPAARCGILKLWALQSTLRAGIE